MPYHRADMSVSKPLVYRIQVAGALTPAFSDYVRGLIITLDTAPGEGPVTTLQGPCADASALVGVLNTLANFGLPLISAECLGAPNALSEVQPEAAAAPPADEAVNEPPAGETAPLADAAEPAQAQPHKAGHPRIGAGAGVIVGGLLGSGGGPGGAAAGAIVGGVAGHYIGARPPALEIKPVRWKRVFNPFAWRAKSPAAPQPVVSLASE
ncbi:MAG: hypothetical protein U0768_17585 [Anaerolineae bacterium]